MTKLVNHGHMRSLFKFHAYLERNKLSVRPIDLVPAAYNASCCSTIWVCYCGSLMVANYGAFGMRPLIWGTCRFRSSVASSRSTFWPIVHSGGRVCCTPPFRWSHVWPILCLLTEICIAIGGALNATKYYLYGSNPAPIPEQLFGVHSCFVLIASRTQMFKVDQ
jgi:hypothetical protein